MTPSQDTPSTDHDPVKIGIVSISDRASTGVYEDKGLPALQTWLGHALKNPLQFESRLIPDEKDRISATLIELVEAGCSLVLTTGGTGFTGRDSTPEALSPLFDKHIEGFGELFRQLSYDEIGTSTVQSRCLAGLSNNTAIFCVPGSTGACKTAWNGIIRQQLDSTFQPCNFVQHVRRKSQ